MNQMVGGGFYISIFSTVLLTKHLLLSVAINSVGNELIFASKNFKNPTRLFDLSVNVFTVISSVNMPTNPSVNVPTDHISNMRALQDVCRPSVNPLVIVAQFHNFLSTLCEIPMGASPLILLSVIVAQFHKFS